MPHQFIILGGGCAGLSICYHLLTQGVRAPILLLEQRSEYVDDRTWCFWDVEPTPFDHLAEHAWPNWTVRTSSGSTTQKSAAHPYRCLHSQTFYDYALGFIRQHDNVTLRLGERVHGYAEQGDSVLVQANSGTYRANIVLDARGLAPGDKLVQQARATSCWLPQQFVGQRVCTTRPIFDVDACTLMDFDVETAVSPNTEAGHGLRFVYVLPYSATEALVENVYLGGVVSDVRHRDEIASYLHNRYGLATDEWRVVGEETGYIPMTDFQFPLRDGERVFKLGTLGGQTRAASGYTFTRIQRYTARLAAHLARDAAESPARASTRLPARLPAVAPPRYRLLDSLFLRYMARYLERCPDLYARLMLSTPADVLARFMMDRSTLTDDLRIVLALPILPFARFATRLLLGRTWDRVGRAAKQPVRSPDLPRVDAPRPT